LSTYRTHARVFQDLTTDRTPGTYSGTAVLHAGYFEAISTLSASMSPCAPKLLLVRLWAPRQDANHAFLRDFEFAFQAIFSRIKPFDVVAAFPNPVLTFER
jgi:hypothetical protein